MRGLLATGLVACGNGVEILDGAIPGVATVTVRGPDGSTAEAAFTDRTSGEVLTSSVELPSDIVQLGLRAGGSYDVAVSVTDDGKVDERKPLEFQAAAPPSSGPTFVPQVYDEGKVCDPDARFLVSWLGTTTGVAIVDRQGNYRWAVQSASEDEQVNRARISRDGTAVHYLYVDLRRRDDIATVVTQPLDGSPATTTRTLNGHHDFFELPDQTTLAWLGYDFRDVPADEIVDLPEPWEGDDPLATASDTIYEAAVGSDGTVEPRTVVNLYDDYFPEHPILYTTRANFRKGAFLPGVHNLTHSNSLALVGDTYLTMLRWVDALLGIDRDTGEIWTLGGVYNEFDPVEGQSLDDLFREAHFSDAWEDEDGLHILVFDNRPSGEDSRLAEYVIDVDDRTFELVWQYQANQHEEVLGDVLRFGIEGCDNRLVSFSQRGRLVEMTPEGEIVWEIATRASSALARVQYLPDLDDPATATYPAE